MEWSESNCPSVESLPVAPSECGATDRGQHEWPQSPSDAQPRLWQDKKQNRQFAASHTDDYKVEEDADMTASSPQFFAAQISQAEYEKQNKSYTTAAIEALTQSPEYQRRFTMCQLCWCSWYLGEVSKNCPECGGHALSRNCPLCDGRCDSTWHRDVEMSHSQHVAHWDGECGLPEEERSNFMLLALMGDATEGDIVDDFSDLATS